VSADGRFAGFVRAGKGGADAVVVAARDGSGEQSMPVFGLAAVDFAPTDDTLASIGAIEPVVTPTGLPIGPLRLIDAATGATRTLLEGTVVTFAWSPDGSTIAAIRLVPAADGSNASTASPSAGASPTTSSPPPAGQFEIRLAFVDVASGKIRSEPEVAPGERYVSALMTYFDQYALSHRLWAPDSSSILLPQAEPDGTTHVDVIYANGDAPVSFDGEIGFWSP
jgi:TolB protein